jgi:L-alanine-DL-glutamate epimerase-like enolase superfamily enzyme
MQEMRIDEVEVRVVAPKVRRYTWSHDIPEQYMTNTVVIIRTDDGLEGIAGVSNYTSFENDKYTAQNLRHIIPILLGKDPLQRETLWQRMCSRGFPFASGAIAVLDIALWDLLGKMANLPIYKLLGGARDRMLSYASTPLLEDIPAYLSFVSELIKDGFRAVKFHTWCIPEKDLALARAVRTEYQDQGVAFMLDVENNYDRLSALRVARELQDLGFTWFEAPLHDSDLNGYRELTSRVDIPVLPSGNWIQDLQGFAHALQTRAWSIARTDVTVCGGITPGKKAMALAEAAGVNCEVMSWGYTLISAANLHVMLSVSNCTYFEQAVPYEAYEYGMVDTIRTGPDGHVSAPKGPGLGVQVDWRAMDAATILKFSSSSRTMVSVV